MQDAVFYALEIVGTVAFAVSGAEVGMKKHMDLLGVMVLGTIQVKLQKNRMLTYKPG